MNQTRTHLVVGTPAYGGMITTLYAASLLKLQHAVHQRGDLDLTVLMPSGDALITRSRQDLVAHFMGMPTATHLLFIDSDIGFEPEQVFRFLDFGADRETAVEQGAVQIQRQQTVAHDQPRSSCSLCSPCSRSVMWPLN